MSRVTNFLLFQLENVIKRTLPNSAFPKLWDSLLKAFQDTSNCHQKRIKVVLTTLEELDNQHSVSSDLCSKLIQRLCMDLVKLRTEHLVDICNFCLNSIQSKQNVKNRYVSIFLHFVNLEVHYHLNYNHNHIPVVLIY